MSSALSKSSTSQRDQTSPSSPQPPASVTRHVFLFGVLFLLLVFICAQSFMMMLSCKGVPSFLGNLALTLLSGTGMAKAGYLTHGCIMAKFSEAEEADWALMFLSVILPIVLVLTRFNPLPTSDDSKANCLVTFAFILRLGSLVDLSPAHSLAQFVLSYPIFSFLDYHRRCHSPVSYPETCTYHLRYDSAPTDCCSTTSFLHHLSTRGISMLVMGFIAVAVPIIISVKHQKDVRVGGEDRQQTPAGQQQEKFEDCCDDFAAVDPAPFESLGIRLVAMLGLHVPLDRFKVMLASVADLVSEPVLVSLVCCPIGFYYFGYALLSRFMPKVFSTLSITSDEWLLGLSVFFVLGRESCRLDMLPSFNQVKVSLATSKEVLRDVLPSHIIDQMINKTPPSSVAAVDDDDDGDQSLPPSANNSGGLLEKMNGPRARRFSTDTSLFSIGTDNLGSSISGSSRGSLPVISRLSKIRPACPLVPGGPAPPVRAFNHAESHDCVTIFFSDIVGFSTWAHELPPGKVMGTLDDLYSRLDDILTNEMPSLYKVRQGQMPVRITGNCSEWSSPHKVETIGDAYMVAGNLTSFDGQHAATVLRFALRAQQEAAKVLRPDRDDGAVLQLRIGIHSGPAVTGIVGKVRRRFCMFGDTVNMSSRTETSCPPGCIQLTEQAHRLASPHISSAEVVFKDRGEIEVKGATKPLRMYLAVCKQAVLAMQGLAAIGMDL